MWLQVLRQTGTSFTEEPAAFIFRVEEWQLFSIPKMEQQFTPKRQYPSKKQQSVTFTVVIISNVA